MSRHQGRTAVLTGATLGLGGSPRAVWRAVLPGVAATAPAGFLQLACALICLKSLDRPKVWKAP